MIHGRRARPPRLRAARFYYALRIVLNLAWRPNLGQILVPAPSACWHNSSLAQQLLVGNYGLGPLPSTYSLAGTPPVKPTLPFVCCLLLVGVVCSAAFAQDKQYARMPWHLVDLWWDVGRDAPFESYSIDVTISEDVPATTNLYIAPIGLGHLSKTPFYGGIQTQADGNTKRDPRLRKIGPGFLMSMWGERSLDAIRPAQGGFCQSSGHEGDFVSVRRPYEWHKGKYTYKIVKMDKEIVDGKPATWVGAFVHSHEKDEHIFIGALRFKGDNLVLDRKIASFVEVYGKAIPVDEIPQVTVTFGNLRVNGEAVEAPPVEAIYPQGVPDYADAKAADAAVVIEVGKPVENRDKRRVRLAGGS